MGRNDHRRILGDVTRRFGRPMFQQERAETAQVNILTADQGVPELLHESFHYLKYFFSVCSRFQGDLIYNFCFCLNQVLH